MPTIRRIGRRGACTAAATACATTALAVLAIAFSQAQPPPPQAPPATARTIAPPGPPVPAPALPHSEPDRITIEKIGLSAPVRAVGIADDGSVALPSDADHTGWYTGSPAPGETGNSILVGHLDTRTGPAAFYGLGALRKGDRIKIARNDGRTAHFAVAHAAVWPRNRFPSDRVYGPASHPQLTLITCADWDSDNRAYRSNLVITAYLTS